MKRDYYSVRTGKLQIDPKLNLDILKRLFLVLYKKYDNTGYFQKYFGYYCVDSEDVPGELGADIEAVLFLHIKKDYLWPIDKKIIDYSEGDLFDIIEFLYDHISKPIDGYYHRFSGCGWHYHEFDDIAGRQALREEINHILKDYEEGYELSETGEVLILPDAGMAELLKAEIPTTDEQNIKRLIEGAILKFRRHKSTWDEKLDAIRDLTAVLEFTRDEAKKHLTRADEADLFNLANNFGIRHHNANQKTDYDKAIWYRWMFNYYLNTIHALLRIIRKAENN
ncbi:hypothetical protein ACO2Q8_11590 [Larkinella sp. VNQ87]|uniref:hypothetical protein n=1 Tax=Larkinella sp. VNQ87 TaxID=3400921 RepID=UPI003C00CBA7